MLGSNPSNTYYTPIIHTIESKGSEKHFGFTMMI